MSIAIYVSVICFSVTLNAQRLQCDLATNNPVAWCVCLFVFLSVTRLRLLQSAKTAEQLKSCSGGGETLGDPKHIPLDGNPNLPYGNGEKWGKFLPIKKSRNITYITAPFWLLVNFDIEILGSALPICVLVLRYIVNGDNFKILLNRNSTSVVCWVIFFSLRVS